LRHDAAHNFVPRIERMDVQPLDIAPDIETTASNLALEHGDRFRDQGLWAEAAEAYGQYLRLRHDDWPIWVQYGHCLKEDGDPKGALLCYREAERLAPGVCDTHLQIGHALKLLGRQEDAFGEYARALTLDPSNPDPSNPHARVELMALDLQAVPAPIAEPPTALAAMAEPAAAEPALVPAPGLPDPAEPHGVPAAARETTAATDTSFVLDASDLLDYCRHNRAPTGIQRVQLNIIREALQDAGAAVTVIAFAVADGVWKAVPAELFLRLAALSRTGTDATDPAWVDVVDAVQVLLHAAPPLEFASGSTLVNLGTSWWIPDYLRRVREAKAQHGLRYVPFLHDCIPPGGAGALRRSAGG
jgi:tetratricopeptide (TPR) repeat protein